MNLPTTIILAVVLILFSLAILRIRRKGSCDCSSCGQASACAGCKAAHTASGTPCSCGEAKPDHPSGVQPPGVE